MAGERVYVIALQPLADSEGYGFGIQRGDTRYERCVSKRQLNAS